MMGYWHAPGSVAYISTCVYVSYEPLPLWGELARTTASQWGMQWLSSSQGPMGEWDDQFGKHPPDSQGSTSFSS